MEVSDRVRGCLLGGAIGDALGAPIEFQSLREIRKHHGTDGITGYVTTWRGRTGLITDDTQMTLFTVEGLLDARVTAAHASRTAGEEDGGARAGARTARRSRREATHRTRSPAVPGAVRARRPSTPFGGRTCAGSTPSSIRRPRPGASPTGRARSARRPGCTRGAPRATPAFPACTAGSPARPRGASPARSTPARRAAAP
ncbi:ADP-ribosylglycohydrolase family protein [Nonomuraea thailandensis]